MKKIIALAGVALLAGFVTAGAAETSTSAATATTHTADSMTSGTHTMAAQKQMHMSNKVMSSHNPNCSEEALAKMPADHRAACGKKD
jgi:hypothetical protein